MITSKLVFTLPFLLGCKFSLKQLIIGNLPPYANYLEWWCFFLNVSTSYYFILYFCNFCDFLYLSDFHFLQELELWGGGFYSDGLIELLQNIGNQVASQIFNVTGIGQFTEYPLF